MRLSEHIHRISQKIAMSVDLYSQVQATIENFFRINDAQIQISYHKETKGATTLSILSVQAQPKSGFVVLKVRDSAVKRDVTVKLPLELGMTSDRIAHKIWVALRKYR